MVKRCANRVLPVIVHVCVCLLFASFVSAFLFTIDFVTSFLGTLPSLSLLFQLFRVSPWTGHARTQNFRDTQDAAENYGAMRISARNVSASLCLQACCACLSFVCRCVLPGFRRQA